MMLMTVTAHYPRDPDAIFAEVLDFDRLKRELEGLIDYHGLPKGSAQEGQCYSFTPVLWTWFRMPEVHVKSLRVDPVAREWHATSVSAEVNKTRHLVRITPDRGGSLWTDLYEMTGPPLNRFQRVLARHIQKAGHRRRRAREIRVSFETP